MKVETITLRSASRKIVGAVDGLETNGGPAPLLAFGR
jgi:hypothetical protein